MLMQMRRAAPWSGLLALALLTACSSAPETNTADKDGKSSLTTTRPVVAVGGDPAASGREVNPFTSGRLSNRVLFAYDRHDLSDEARGVVGKWGEYLRAQPSTRFTIEGHADERGTREYNLALGDRRAMSVRDHLLASGARPSQIKTVSYGKERPDVPGASEQAWSQNRRAVALLE
jgi:peptidoglycan-associated lipoprotein